MQENNKKHKKLKNLHSYSNYVLMSSVSLLYGLFAPPSCICTNVRAESHQAEWVRFGVIVESSSSRCTCPGIYINQQFKCCCVVSCMNASPLLESWVTICDRACKNRPCECKLYQVTFSLISFVQNIVFHFSKLQKKAH